MGFARKSFRSDVSNVVRGGNVAECEVAGVHSLSHEVVVDVDMFRPLVEDGILGDFDACLVVAEDVDRDTESKFSKA